jgi:hypothetical protein
MFGYVCACGMMKPGCLAHPFPQTLSISLLWENSNSSSYFEIFSVISLTIFTRCAIKHSDLSLTSNYNFAPADQSLGCGFSSDSLNTLTLPKIFNASEMYLHFYYIYIFFFLQILLVYSSGTGDTLLYLHKRMQYILVRFTSSIILPPLLEIYLFTKNLLCTLLWWSSWHSLIMSPRQWNCNSLNTCFQALRYYLNRCKLQAAIKMASFIARTIWLLSLCFYQMKIK